MRELVGADWLQRDGGQSLARTREVIRRGQTLAERLQSQAEAKKLRPLTQRLGKLDAGLATLEGLGTPAEATQREVWLEAHRTVREIAFCNPRLREIDKLLFITRHDAGGVFHMVDQFYGFNAKPGGRLLVLVEPFGEEPRLVDLLADSVVKQGRLNGRELEGGAFLSPEVSFDGKTILFAWTEAQGKDLEWSPTASYHLFKCNADGSGLVQLTDGPWNDFDPCFLPSGRIAFISERRGGYLRCGRHCPTYTVFGMAADGGDVICLSYHETHEWHPSITHDGHIIYTRWDYVDRDTNIAHHPWTCRPDGGDPRAIHGNYPTRRESRPWMEMDLRAIPGSRKFVATAAAHHGHAFGSLVILDPQAEDDGAQLQLTRLTPEVPFPEAEAKGTNIARTMIYGTAWPLSEDDFLCVYGADATNRGVYWIDRIGNKELLYRDPAISSVSPMPLKARPKPPVIPDATLATAEAKKKAAQPDQPATIALMNVYDSDFAWPADTRITALRVLQVLPKSTPPPNEPRIGVAEQSNARAVLGTVPVESDGSAYFEAPAGKSLYFQALDERGFAVQSMRSVTYVHPGERLTCQGCHEPRHRAPPARSPLEASLAQGAYGVEPPRLTETVPIALRRAPSKLQPDVDGSNPFNFVRLVQPALDRNCVACHQEKKALDLASVVEGKHGWTRSYANLAGKYGFYFHVFNGAINTGVHGGTRTIAGQFGALASPLLPFLDERHYGVKLSPEDLHRLTLWLDCNSEFYGTYENTVAQGRGEVVKPALE
ncbi:MAG: hypothetical protein HYY24_05955 [Verrucomicrobia bacterium]|nr:hypothetical protein [Verrucomicrobiota bacterium]